MAPPLGPPSIHRPPPPRLQENHFPTNSKAFQNPSLDIFFSNTYLYTLIEKLEESWTRNPLTTLQLMSLLRGAEIAGKKSDEAFYVAMHWLHKKHPLTLACNVRVFVSFGCLKHLLHTLRRVLEDEEVDIEGKKIQEGWRRQRVKEEEKENENPNPSKQEKIIARAKKAVERFARDADYRFLHNQISESIADLLRSDLGFLESGEIEKISIASKLCPSIDSDYDRSTLICENIARKLFPKSNDEYLCLEEAHYSYRVRIRLQKQVLVPLRKALDSSPNRVCMEETRVCKMANPNPRLRYVPQKIVSSLRGAGQFTSNLADLQWRQLIQRVSKIGNFNNCLAVCTVYKEMDGALRDFSITMGLLISELTSKPWKGRVIAFESCPKLLNIEGHDLKSKVEFMKKMNCGKRLNMSKVYEQVLNFAVNRKVSPDKMVETIYVFTDSECMGDGWMRHRFGMHGYKSKGYHGVPGIVVWNLAGDGRCSPKGISRRLVNRWLIGGEVSTKNDLVKLDPEAEDLMESASYFTT